ncbi:MAG: DNA internalization-related competence protein ComEC/Rec2 [Betaproteobacteria bacterium]|nr:DNA internalization-related competence protein ComEC/Rec2 [Betaproteobacteria bacterium]
MAWLLWLAGIAVQLQQAELWPAGVCVAVGAAALAWLRLCPLPQVRLLALAALSWALTGVHALLMPAPMPGALEGRDLDVQARVEAMVQRQDSGIRMRVRIEHATLHGQPVSVPENVFLGWYAASARDEGLAQPLPEVQPGERWRWRVRLKAAHGHLNPGGFDYELWLWEQGVRATGYVRQGRGDPAPLRLGSSAAHPVEWLRQHVRGQILARAGADPAAQQRAGVLAALVTGDQAAIERSDWDVFRATGVAHLMSISGLHVTMLAWLASMALAGLWRRTARWGWRASLHWPAPQVGALGGLAVAGAYALFAGWGVPAQRTVWMLALFTLLRLSARQWPVSVVWAAAAVLVLTLDPWAALQPGFWLSFVAVGVLWASAPLGHAPRREQDTGREQDPVPGHTPAHRLGAWGLARARALVGGLLREQLVLSLALAPLSLLFFGQFSLVGLLANLLAIPWVTLVLTPLALAGVLCSPLWDAASGVLAPLSALLAMFAAWPLASVQLAMPPWPWALLATLGAVLVLMPWPWAWRVWGLVWCLPALCWTPPRPAPGQFELLAADVGQGNAVLVRTATRSLLYDAGPRYSPESDAGHRVLLPLLARTQEPLDRLLLSHRDSDHTGGAPALLAMRPQAQLWSSLEPDHPLWALRPGTRCEAGQHWDWDGVQFELLHPEASAYDRPNKPNALSCVLRITGQGGTALLVGDIEAAQERALLARGLASQGPVDWLLVPHHGSRTSSSEAFVQALRPRIALVQAGYRNRFGHPVAEVAQRYAAQGTRWVETSRCGAALWRSAQADALECTRATRQRYWHHRQPPEPPP